MKLRYEIGELRDAQTIHQASLEILQDVGVVIHSPEAVKVFRKHGAKVDGNTVYLSEDMVSQAVESAPSFFDWYGSEGGVVHIGDLVTQNLPAYGPVAVYSQGEYQEPTHQHLVDLHKMSETSPVMAASNPNVLDCPYIPLDIREDYRLGVALKYCRKPLMGLNEGFKVSQKCLETMRRYYGVEDLQSKVLAVGLIDTMGPNQIPTSMCEAILTYAQAKQALLICSGEFCGVTSPQSLAATFILGNSTILACIVLAQLVNPGTPVIYSGKMDSDDLRITSATAYGGIEAMLATATCRMMASYYQIPLHTGNSNTDSKVMDYQCGKETFMNLFNAYMNHSECFMHACGLMDAFGAISFEKYVLDEEMILEMRRLLQGYEITPDKIMMDKIKEVGPAGQHFGRTQKSYREDFYMPKYAVRDNKTNWLENGSPTSEMLARDTVKKRLASYVEPEHSKEQREILDSLLPEGYR